MTVTPSGIYSLPLSNMRTMLSNCAAFRTWTGTATVALALAQIHYGGADPATDTAPLAIVDFAPGSGGRESVAQGQWRYSAPLAIDVTFIADVSAQTSDSDALLTHWNNVGAIVSDVEGLAGTGGYLGISRSDIADGPTRVVSRERATRGDWAEMTIRFSVGVAI